MNVREIGQLLRARKISCVELIEQTLADIAKRDVYHCFITLMEDEARREAKERDLELADGRDRGPFHGVPIAYKDLFYTRGVRTTAGSLLFQDFVPYYDAAVVERLKAAGAISLGKTNLHELAYGITSKNPHFGFVSNPRDTDRIPGGSSGGSAALIAAGFAPVSPGSDTGGSIRIPASYCGVTGLKPTYGRVSRFGVLPLAFSLDHVGPLGSCVEDCALTMNRIAGPDSRDATCVTIPAPDFNLPPLSDLKKLRVGVPKNFFFDCLDGEVAAAVKRAIAEMGRHGASLLDIEVPDFEEINAVARIIQMSETAALYEDQVDETKFGQDVWALIQQGKMVYGHEYVNAQRLRTVFRRRFDELWNEIDVLAAPTTPIAAPLISEDTVRINSKDEDARMASTRLVRGINLIGEPALSVPCGKTSKALPIGLQLISAPFTEPKLLQIGKTVEAFVAS